MFDFIVAIQSINFRCPPPLPYTHTQTHTCKLTVNEATLCTNPFVFTPLFPPNNVQKPNPKPSSTNLGHLLTSHSAAKRPAQARSTNRHLKTELHMHSFTEHILMNALIDAHVHPNTLFLSLFWPRSSISLLPSWCPSFSGIGMEVLAASSWEMALSICLCCH